MLLLICRGVIDGGDNRNSIVKTLKNITYRFNNSLSESGIVTENYNKNDISTLGNTPAIIEITLSSGQCVEFKNKNNYFSSRGDYGISFDMTKNTKVYGNIQSLLNNREDVPEFSFKGLFLSCSKLVDISNLILPSKNLGIYCYVYMFYNCSNLSGMMNELPAINTEQGCYCGMFGKCVNITKTPIIYSSNLKLYALNYMFKGCSKLKEIYIYAKYKNYSKNSGNSYFMDFALGSASSGKLYSYFDGIKITNSIKTYFSVNTDWEIIDLDI